LPFPLQRSLSVAVATRQTSSSGRPKSPRIQVVLPEELCERLAALADGEARTVSNMARVLIQQGVDRLERQRQEQSGQERGALPGAAAERWRERLEQQGREAPRRLRGAPRRVRLLRPPGG
jgi:hypothetical protein